VSHANARLTFHGRCLLIERVLVDGRPVSHVAKELGISRQAAHRWVARFRAEGVAGLHDRSSRPHRMPRRTPVAVEAVVVAARQELRAGRDRVAEATGVPARTVSAILARHRMPPIAVLDPVTGAVIRASKATEHRYERPAPGDLLHLDVKKLGRIRDGGGWRLLGRDVAPHGHGRRDRGGDRIGFDYVHAAVDDHSRLAYAEIHPDEKGTTCAAFLARAAQFFAAHGITVREVMTDNAKNYVLSRDFQAVLADLDARHVLIRPYCPWQNGKVERFNRTLQAEWAYRQPFTSNTQRADALEPWLNHYNNDRTHHGIGGNPPISRIPS
jgi:transposase InsO family protein